MKTTEKKFEAFKSEILRRAKAVNACAPEYKRALQSGSFRELMTVIKNNFHFACRQNVIDSELIELYKSEFSENGIFCNVDVSSGFLLASGTATVKAYGTANVEASGTATVEAYGTATVKAYGTATVKAYGTATVEASDSATVEAYGTATVKAYGTATVKAYGTATVKASGSATVKASGSATVKASGSATVEASDSAYVTSYCAIECKLSDNAIHRIRESNVIRYVSDSIKFEKVETHNCASVN
ncbi:MAG: DUF2807 domain-containing protein [Dysgonamonadaceae bacterium]|jgi:hypothetical protein|nr:DUF2807 domain-containing protein [Dysgonamonadaceae bacterium]